MRGMIYNMTEFAVIVQRESCFYLSIPIIFDDEHGNYARLEVKYE